MSRMKYYKPTTENKKIELSVTTAKDLADEFEYNDTELGIRFGELLKEQLDKHEKEIRKIREKQYCEHEWHEFTKEDIYRLGTPKSWKIEDRGKEYIEDFYQYMFGYCEKCNMPYKFNIFSDKDFDRIVQDYETEDVITIKAYNSSSRKLFDRLLEEKIED